jgi:hypothetical protein
MKTIFKLLFFFSFIQPVFCETKKSVEAFFINTPIKIDGILNEEIYKSAIPATILFR